MITKFHKSNGRFAVAASLLAALGLARLTDAQTEKADAPPRIVSTSPKIGVTEVDPALKEIKVTFDRDMGGGMSWTGGGPDYPKVREGAKAYWQPDKRTCVLPVRLQPGHFYRVGVNSPSHQSFRGENGLPAAAKAITFRTSGTPVKSKAPEIVSLNPPNGANDVSPAVAELRVTFNVPMDGGMSWCGGGPHYPASPAGKGAYWTGGGKTCVLPVELKPGWDYQLGINSLSFKNFRSDEGVSLAPVGYAFKTSE